VRSTNALALDLLRAGAPPADRNTVFSPYSVQAALAMVYAGAAGQTAAQIGHVLGAPSATDLAAANRALAARLAAAAGGPHARAPDLRIANGLWLQSGLRLEPEFVRTMNDAFGPALQDADFRAQPEAARVAINAWIAAHTAGLIRGLMSPGSITASTELVLANAVYLKALWSNQFESGATAPGTFFTAAGMRVTTPFMSRSRASLGYAAGAAFRAVDLPYRDTTLSMLVVMPTAGTIGAFQRSLTPASLAALSASLRPELIDLRMPRFHLLAQTELSSALSTLGMPVAFTDRADFSGITKQVRLAISAVQHGADLKADEAGTVAAAATGIAISPTAVLPGRIARLSLDHPFLLFLRDDSSGAILFAGRVADPTQS
jgi:serpin B